MIEINQKFVAKNRQEFYEGKFADVEIHVNGKVFKVSTHMLFIRSPIFEAMFNYDTEEKRSKIIKIKGHDQKIVEKFLLYFYIGFVEELEEIGEEIFALADYYQVEDLKQTILEMMYETFSIENVCSRFLLSEKFCLNLLREKAVIFMHSNINIETMVRFYELSVEQNLLGTIEKILSFIKANIDVVTNSSEWENFDISVQLDILKSLVKQFSGSGNEELLKNELSLTITKIATHPRAQNWFYGSSRDYFVRSFLLKNNDQKRVAYQFALKSFNEPHFSPNPENGFIEPHGECEVVIKNFVMNSDAFLLYEASDKQNIEECFKNDSFVRQIQFELSD